MLTLGKGRGRAPSLLLTIFLGLAMAVGVGAAAPGFALTLGGTVANDTNGNGVLDPTDTPLAGISVTVQPAGGGVSAATTTTASGTYSFSGLAPGSYTVSVGAASGLINATPASVTVTLTINRNDIDFLFVAPGLIGGRVISDLNGNGIAEPTEPGLPGVPVDLNRIDNLGQATLIDSITTGSDGTFVFPIQPAGTYTVVAHPQAGVVATGANAGSSGTAVVLDPNTIRVVLNGNQAADGLRFAERTPQTAGISGFVLDNTGKPLANVLVEQRDASQNLLATTMTDATGAYAFSSVAAGGTYIIHVIPPPGYAIQHVSPAAPATALGTSEIEILNFSPGTNYANNNFTLAPSAAVSPVTPGAANAISGEVINDLLGDGMFNAGDPGLAGALLTLRTTSGISYGTMTTGPSGAFTFVNLPADDYLLIRTNPPGYRSTGVQPGVGGTSLNVDTIQIHVTGTNNLYSGQLFLATATSVVSPTVGILSGSVFQVVNGTNLPLPGVTIQLAVAGGPFFTSTTTDVNGAWAFANLPTGTYEVHQMVPFGYTAISSDTLTLLVSAGFNNGNNNFLDQPIAITRGNISGSVFRVVNGTNQPLPGVTIQLAVAGGPFYTSTTTDANGAWAFGNLLPGTYEVHQVVPFGYTAISSETLTLTVFAGFNNGNNNFLDQVVTPPAGAHTISGFALEDRNLSGSPNNAPGLAGMLVVLYDQFNNPFASVTTDITGSFSFSNLAAGTYVLRATPPSGLHSTNAIAGQGGVPLSASSIQVTITPGVTTDAGQLFLAGP